MEAKGRKGSLFSERTQNDKVRSCCHGGLVQDFLGAFVLKNLQRIEGWHDFWSDWIVLYCILKVFIPLLLKVVIRDNNNEIYSPPSY